MTVRTFVLFVLLAVVAARSLNSISRADEISIYEKALLSKQINPDVASLKKYLNDLHPTQKQRDEALAQIKLLGHENFATRENATTRLLILPALPVDELTAAFEGGDPEVRWRAKAILTQGRTESAATLYAAFKTIQDKKLAGAIEGLLGAIPLCEERHMRTAAREAIIDTAREADQAILEKGIEHKYVEVRAAAVAGLAKALGEKSAAALQSIVANDDEQDAVKVVAARALANLGERQSLTSLVSLLNSDDVFVRVDASLALQHFTDQHFGFAAYDTDQRRAESIKKWSEWIAADGKTAKLNFPLPRYDSRRGYLNGNTLLAFGYKNKVAEYNPEGKEIWTYQAQGAWSAEKLSNGNVLVANYSANNVVEVDRKGEVVWKYDVNTPLNARPLANGNILVSSHGASQIHEVNREGKIIWQHTTTGNACDAHRLDNGNTVYCGGQTVVEVTPDGKTVWEHQAGQPFGIQPLANGNILICDLSGKVVEMTRDKKVVWEVAEANPVDAFRLPNGNTLITGGQRFIEYSPDKKEIWKLDGCNYGTARR